MTNPLAREQVDMRCTCSVALAEAKYRRWKPSGENGERKLSFVVSLVYACIFYSSRLIPFHGKFFLSLLYRWSISVSSNFPPRVKNRDKVNRTSKVSWFQISISAIGSFIFNL